MEEWWKEVQWRFIQTNLREIDMLDINAEQYVKDLKDFKATIAMINTSGIIASYPTKLPYHFQSPYLKGDSLNKIIEECHKTGIKVIARTDFSKVRRPVYEEHPEWAYISPEGKIVDYNGDIHVCVNGEYQQKYALEIIRETLAELDVDGIFFNMGGYQVSDYSGNYHGLCQCANCQKRFKEMYGSILPKKEDMKDPAYRKYLLFKKQTIQEYQLKMYNFIKSLRPDIAVANSTEKAVGFIRQESNTAIERPLPHWQYSASENTKWVKGSFPEMISSNTTVDFIDFPYRHVAISPAQQELRLIQNLANAGAIDYYLIGRLDNHQDRSGYNGIKRVFHYHAANERYYHDLQNIAEIALIRGFGNTNEYRGWYRFLTEKHYLFDVVLSERIENLGLEKYKAVVLPDLKYVGDGLAKVLDKFAQDGGVVIASGESGLYDDKYEERGYQALECLGIEKVKYVRADMSSSCFRVDDKESFKRFKDMDLLYNGDSYVFADYTKDAKQYLKLIPPHHFGPPERCYYTQVTELPGLTVSSYHKGKGVFIPWKPGQLFYRQGYTNTMEFAADLLENILGLKPVEGNVPPMVEVTVSNDRGNEFSLIHLVNGTGHFGNTFYAPVVLHSLKASIPFDKVPSEVISLKTGKGCSYKYLPESNLLELYIDELDAFEALKVT